ncbi:PREDICTED: WAP four-disulfide core domain protein 2-like isoform X2 [Dufourea novaeangliae]|uniref:WAP four-disulfide core domain protein 2-like isoform X2 n=1 Tax=Dufourea novaeangliae TaxID=178035 RepID=UPI000767DCA8|nr:PREDICTED: WAP four-disulfide core domain protein 2-like isoform X2 [Dufourea novaeangliae]
MKSLLVTLALSLILATSYGQSRYEPFAEKPGSCPPAVSVQICTRVCSSDSDCLGIAKCCSTTCEGKVCSMPVTMRQANHREKPGSCPAVPKGRWVCTPTCSVDNDCRGNLKCCKNRCGALACQKPDIEVVESVEIPVVPLPEDPNNSPRNPYETPRNPYETPRNPYDTPRNPYDTPRNPYDTPRNPYETPRNPYNNPRDPNSYPYYFYNN